jgi:GMP synthase (glutamine-hydrolysing)
LMASALVELDYPGTNGKEIGWYELNAASGTAGQEWFTALLAPSLRVLHWHGDTFDLPDGAIHLAQTSQYAHQAFCIGNHALALQFHPEVKAEGLERWYVGHACELSQTKIDVRQLREESKVYAPQLENSARQFWRQWLRHAFGEPVTR